MLVEAFYQLLHFSKYRAAIRCDSHYHCQRSLAVLKSAILITCLAVTDTEHSGEMVELAVLKSAILITCLAVTDTGHSGEMVELALLKSAILITCLAVTDT